MKQSMLNDPKGELKYEYTKENYMQRQPRVDISKYNYNFEQFKEFTWTYEKARTKDREELR